MQEKFRIITSKGFVAGLALLLLNDFVLKSAFHNGFTGKLSDVAGLFIFPLFWFAFFPKQKKAIFFSTALFFIYWKSPFSQPLIDLWNTFNLVQIQRIVDYSDLIALLVLPLSFYYSSTETKRTGLPFHPFLLILVASFSFVATSKYHHFPYADDPFYSDPVKYGKEIPVDAKAYSFSTGPDGIIPLFDKYNIPYFDQISNDSILYFQAFRGYDSLPPVIKMSKQYVPGKTILQIRSVIFDPKEIDDIAKKREYYKTENAATLAKNFEAWFMHEIKTVKESDSLNALAASLYKAHPDSAISIYNAALKTAPLWVNAKLMLNYGLGNSYFQKKEYHQALKYYYRADSVNNQYSHYHMRAAPYFGLEATYKKLGQKDSAKKYRKLASNAYTH